MATPNLSGSVTVSLSFGGLPLSFGLFGGGLTLGLFVYFNLGYQVGLMVLVGY